MSWVFTGLLAFIISRKYVVPSLSICRFRSLARSLSLTDSATAAFKLGKQIAFIHWCFSFSFSHFLFITPAHTSPFSTIWTICFSFASICYHALFACGAAAYISPDNIFNRQQWYIIYIACIEIIFSLFTFLIRSAHVSLTLSIFGLGLFGYDPGYFSVLFSTMCNIAEVPFEKISKVRLICGKMMRNQYQPSKICNAFCNIFHRISIFSVIQSSEFILSLCLKALRCSPTWRANHSIDSV